MEDAMKNRETDTSDNPKNCLQLQLRSIQLNQALKQFFNNNSITQIDNDFNFYVHSRDLRHKREKRAHLCTHIFIHSL